MYICTNETSKQFDSGEDNRVYIDARYAQSLINQSVEAVVERMSDAMNESSPLHVTAEVMVMKWRLQVLSSSHRQFFFQNLSVRCLKIAEVNFWFHH